MSVSTGSLVRSSLDMRLKYTHHSHEPLELKSNTHYYRENVPKIALNTCQRTTLHTHMHTNFPCQFQTSHPIHQYITTCSEASSSILLSSKEVESKGAGHRDPFTLKPQLLCCCLAAPGLIQTWQYGS